MLGPRLAGFYPAAGTPVKLTPLRQLSKKAGANRVGFFHAGRPASEKETAPALSKPERKRPQLSQIRGRQITSGGLGLNPEGWLRLRLALKS